MSKICRHCKFWAGGDRDEGWDTGVGECRRHAPTGAPSVTYAGMLGNVTYEGWTKTYAVDWCGDFEEGEPLKVIG